MGGASGPGVVVWPNGAVASVEPPYPGQASSGFRATSEYGWRTHPVTGQPDTFHSGIDLVGWSTNVSPVNGRITRASWFGGYGNCIDVTAANGDVFRIGHNARLLVGYGDYVSAGQAVAIMGTTGNSTGVHTHFETRPGGGSTINPRDYMKAAAIGEDDFLMGLAQWQQEAIFNALWSPQGYYKTDAIVNILRGEIEPRIDSIAAGNVLFPGAPYNAFQALANNQHAIMEAISKIDPNGDPVDFERILRESEDRTYAGIKAQFEAFSAVMRSELVAALADAEGLTKEQIMEAVDGSFARAFAPVQANVDAAIAANSPESSA